jgi:hypothetical protein
VERDGAHSRCCGCSSRSSRILAFEPGEAPWRRPLEWRQTAQDDTWCGAAEIHLDPQPAALADPQRKHTDGAASQVRTGTALRNFTARTGDESWMREICTSSLTRGRDIARQAWYAVFRHIRGNPETRSTENLPLPLYPLYSTRRRYSCAGEASAG